MAMKLEFCNKKDFWAGMAMIAIGGAAMFIARDYRFGSALRMGPGFFPTILGGILIAFGIFIMAVGLRRGERIAEHLSLRALIMLPLSMILFGVLMKRAGFLPALAAVVFVSAAADRESRLLEVLLLGTVLTVASTAVFIWGLGLPYPLIKGF
jgi:hypothetical protein